MNVCIRNYPQMLKTVADMHAALVHLKQECDYDECVYKKLSSNAENSS